ncbi:MAG TPA: IS66 family transposase [Thermoanaerobaculia bacterium]|nr:IS66 family transposase [Thermoanaerobaculia bacterium]
MNREALGQLSKDDLIAVVLAQAEVVAQQAAHIEKTGAEIAALTRRVAELEAKLGQPPKTPDNSSVPPSQGQKPNRAERRAAKKRKGRPGAFRQLAAHPDRVVEAMAEACPHCDHRLGPADQAEVHAWDHVELPPIRPVVTRVHRHRGVCPGCRRGFVAPAPEGMAPGSPFGPGLQALVLHLHVTQAIGFERLVRLMREVFGVELSEGAIANMLARAEAPMVVAAEKIAAQVRASKVVASDETSARVQGKTWWQWVLLSSTAVHHLIADTRAACVVTGFLQGAKPEIWVADRYAGQNGHASQRQICLAHLLRDAQYAIDEGDRIFAPAFKALLLRAVAIGRRRAELKDTTLQQYRADLDRRLDRLLATPPKAAAARKLFSAMRRHRDDLFRFVTRRDVPYTNNGCERALRPSVIFRKVTGGFRSHWGARLYAAAQSVIATGRLNGISALKAIVNALAPTPQAATA